MEVLCCPVLLDFRKILLFGRFPGFAPLSFSQMQRVGLGEDEIEALVG
jgi:hypothetical protein